MRLDQRGIVVVAVISIAAGAAQVRGDTLAVYGDALAPGWQNLSRNTTVSLLNSAPTYGGAGASISARYDAAWAGLYLHNGAASDIFIDANVQTGAHVASFVEAILP